MRNSKKKILVVLTGGTIGSTVNGNTINVEDSSTPKLLQVYKEKYGSEGSFEVCQPYNILSENLTLNTWNALIDFLENQKINEYQGIIITHGTDTFSYSASLIATLYENRYKVPIILVASNYAIGESDSNGLNNFRNAVCFIKESSASGENGIYCIYENSRGENEVFRGTEIMEADTCIDQFQAYGGMNYGSMVREQFVLNQNHCNHCEPYRKDWWKRLKKVDLKDGLFSNDVLMIKTYPGLNFDYYKINDAKVKPKAVLICLYHSATACLDEDFKTGKIFQNSLKDFVLDCVRNEIKVYACGFKKELKNAYITLQEIETLPLTKIYDASPEAAYANVLLDMNMTK
jgi:L-asparaginase